eukprot:2089105-Pleurochrysis_carterae.AAC.2
MRMLVSTPMRMLMSTSPMKAPNRSKRQACPRVTEPSSCASQRAAGPQPWPRRADTRSSCVAAARCPPTRQRRCSPSCARS